MCIRDSTSTARDWLWNRRISGQKCEASSPVRTAAYSGKRVWNAVVKGVPVRGIGTTIELDEQGFAGEGDLYLFASVVDEVLAAHAGLNTFSELKAKAHPSQAEYQWTAKSGRQTIL